MVLIGERQKRRLEQLEALEKLRLGLELQPQSFDALDIDTRSSLDGSQSSRDSDSQQWHVPRTLPANEPPTQSHVDTKAFIQRHVLGLNDRALEKIDSGQVGMADILRAGLTSLQLLAPEADTQSPSCSLESRGSNSSRQVDPPAGLRADRIIVPQNKMHIQTHSLPEDYFNSLRLRKYVTVAALRANADLLGVAFEKMIHAEAPSIFHRSGEGSSDVSWTKLPADLQPTPTQIRYPHPVYVDVFPFPVLRDQIITMMSDGSPAFNTKDFCKDLEKEGLICWGSTMDEGEGTGSGAPWDSRSWEAQPWFLKKWWYILGGSDGPVFKQTRWWHELRGDRFPDLW